jgi:hypothetical protein
LSREEDQGAVLSCFCSEREKDPRSFSHVPDGFCGFCDICGEPGHVRPHPTEAFTGAWCDEHWRDLEKELAASRPDLRGWAAAAAFLLAAAILSHC